MKFKLFKRKKKELPAAPKQLKKRASAKTNKAIKFFKDELSAVELLETDGRRKFVHSGYTPRERLNINWREVGKWAGLAVATAFVAIVMYWGIKQ